MDLGEIVPECYSRKNFLTPRGSKFKTRFKNTPFAWHSNSLSGTALTFFHYLAVLLLEILDLYMPRHVYGLCGPKPSCHTVRKSQERQRRPPPGPSQHRSVRMKEDTSRGGGEFHFVQVCAKTADKVWHQMSGMAISTCKSSCALLLHDATN